MFPLHNRGKYMNDNVVVLRLTSGEEIVCRFIKDDDFAIVVDRPRQIMFTPTQTGGVQAQLAPVLFSHPDCRELKIFNHALAVAPIPAPENLSKAYLENTSGIAFANQMPKSGQLLRG
jgi:hypothetical protein